MSKCFSLPAFSTVLVASALGAAPISAQAADKATSNDWEFGASIYLWGAGVEGATDSGIDFDVDFDDILTNLDMAFMGTFEVRKGKWSLLTDLIYLDAKINDSASVPVPGLPGQAPTVKVDGDLELKSWFLNFLAGYEVRDTDQWSLTVVGGARYFDLDFDLDLGANVGRQSPSTKLKPSVDVLDGVVGVRGKVYLGEKWYLPYYADGGTGQSDSTWQAFGGVAYRFGWGDVALVYRYIKWNFDSSSAINDATLGGPLLSASFQF